MPSIEQLFHDGENSELIRQMRYEEAAVKHILKVTGLQEMEQDLKQQQSDATNECRLTLQRFATNTSFPMVLCARKIPNIHTISIVDLLTQHRRKRVLIAPFSEEWLQYSDDDSINLDRSGAFGMIFYTKRIKFVAMHHCESTELAGHTCLVMPFGRRPPVVLETLDDLLQRVGPPNTLGTWAKES